MTVKHKFQRVGVFIDVSNMYYSAKNLYNAYVNFGEVLKTAVAGRQLIRAFAYVIRAFIEPEKSFFEALEKQGFEVKVKDLQVFPGGMKKGDWDVGVCMDAITMIQKLDVMVLVSGDGDYADLLDYVRNEGVRTEVISFSRTTSGKLIAEADEFLDMEKNPTRFLIKNRPSASSRSASVPGAPEPGLTA